MGGRDGAKGSGRDGDATAEAAAVSCAAPTRQGRQHLQSRARET